MTGWIEADALKEWLHDGGEVALIDVREHGQYGESHPFFAVSLPYSRLEVDIARLVPRRGARIVVHDDGTLGVAQRAAVRLEAVGYGNVHVLRGGTRAWAAAGYALFAGVNVPGKAFGEMVEHACGTPRMKARELAAKLAAGEPVAVIDGRPVAEYRKMNIPRGVCCPNGELAYRIARMVPDARTPIVVNCAGRTRSIIGAQTLIDLGLANPVFALENGTQGWYLEDLALEHGSDRTYPAVPRDADLGPMRARAAALAERHGAGFAGAAEVNLWFADEARTTYLFDVRTAEEFAAGTAMGAVHAPGGQLLQATDQWVGVRNARIVLVDAEGVRAPVVASWLRRMGHEAWVLRGGTSAGVQAAIPAPIALPLLEAVAPRQLASWMEAGHANAIDLRPSRTYRKAHVAGSLWSIRPRLEALQGRIRGRAVLVADDAGVAQAAALDLADLGLGGAALLAGGFAAWEAAGLPVEESPRSPPDSECIDYLYFVHDRHDGNKEAARRYLAWETDLLNHLDARERASFRFPAPGAAA